MRITSTTPPFKTKRKHSVMSTTRSESTSKITPLTEVYTTEVSKSLVAFNEPELFPISKEEKDKFINSALYKDEKRLLQVILNEIYKTPIGKNFIPFIEGLRSSNKIVFEESSDSLDAHAIFGIKSMQKNDVQIIIAKDNCIPFLAGTLIHEISHYIDFRELFTHDKKYYTRLETETKAFANSYRFLLEGGHLSSFWYAFTSLERDALLTATYEYEYKNKSARLKTKVYDALVSMGYTGLEDRIQVVNT